MSNRYEYIVKGGRINSSQFWQIEDIKGLNYIEESFNDPMQLDSWLTGGHQPRGGMLYDMRFSHQPFTTGMLVDKWSNDHAHVGVSYYKMRPGDNLPYHSDTYKKYIEKFNIANDDKWNIWRYIIFVEDWKPGHILEINGRIVTNWYAGEWVAWNYDTPHMAANLGDQDRFTIQLTGLKRKIA